jgi:hypothetical protein
MLSGLPSHATCFNLIPQCITKDPTKCAMVQLRTKCYLEDNIVVIVHGPKHGLSFCRCGWRRTNKDFGSMHVIFDTAALHACNNRDDNLVVKAWGDRWSAAFHL